MGFLIPKLLRDAGSEIVTDNSTANVENGYTFILKIKWYDGQKPSFTLTSSVKEEIVKQGVIDPGTGNPHRMAACFVKRLLLDHIYNAAE
jgi:hypothetical protein